MGIAKYGRRFVDLQLGSLHLCWWEQPWLAATPAWTLKGKCFHRAVQNWKLGNKIIRNRQQPPLESCLCCIDLISICVSPFHPCTSLVVPGRQPRSQSPEERSRWRTFMVWEEKLVLLQVLWWETYLEEHFPSVPGTPDVLSKLIGVWRMLCGWGRVACFGDYKIFKALCYLKLLPFCLTEGSPGKKYALTLPRWGKIPGQLLGDPSQRQALHG